MAEHNNESITPGILQEEYEAREKLRAERKLIEISNQLTEDAHSNPKEGLAKLSKEKLAKLP
jgi:hypothetical protein